MDKYQKENWKKIKKYMESVDKTDNPYYRRAAIIEKSGKDPGEFFEYDPPNIPTSDQ